MSFLSVLKSIGKFTPLGQVVSGIGKLAGGAANQRSNDRAAQGEFDLLNNATYNNQNLQRADFKRKSDQGRMREIAGTTMLSSLQPPSDPRAQKFFTGGRMSEPDIEFFRSRAHQALGSGSDVPSLRETTLQKPGKMDTFLRALSGAGTTLDMLKTSGLFGGDDDTPDEGPVGLLDSWKMGRAAPPESAPADPLAAGSFEDWIAQQQKQGVSPPTIAPRRAALPPPTYRTKRDSGGFF